MIPLWHGYENACHAYKIVYHVGEFEYFGVTIDANDFPHRHLISYHR